MARDRDDEPRDDDKDDAPRSRRRRDDDDDTPSKPGGLEGFFANTPLAIILAIVFIFCCSPAGIILGGIGMGTCKLPDAKRNAMIMLILNGVALVVGIILRFTVFAANAAAANNNF